MGPELWVTVGIFLVSHLIVAIYFGARLQARAEAMEKDMREVAESIRGLRNDLKENDRGLNGVRAELVGLEARVSALERRE